VSRGDAEVDEDERRRRRGADEEVGGLDVAVDILEAVQASDDAQHLAQEGQATLSGIFRS
jgi:hypothetical protein